MFERLFITHPASVDESWAEHCAVASGFGVRMILGGLACLVHAVIPGFFVKTGSQQIALLYDRMVANRRRVAREAPHNTALEWVI